MLFLPEQIRFDQINNTAALTKGANSTKPDTLWVIDVNSVYSFIVSIPSNSLTVRLERSLA
jgi:hypothetical protein